MQKLSSFGRDTGLQVRMATVMLLLGAVYVVFVGALLTAGVGAASFIDDRRRPRRCCSCSLRTRWRSPRWAPRRSRPQQAPELHAMIERLCVQADLPKPTIAIANTRMPNAFALGRSPKNATVCATTGIMELLSPAELEGVMAHELTHIANRDVMVMTLASFFATIAAYIVQFGFYFGGGMAAATTRTASASSPCSSSRWPSTPCPSSSCRRCRATASSRPTAARRSSPAGRAHSPRALMKISSGMHQIPQQDLRATSQLAAFYIFPPEGGKSAFGELFSTHPAMEKRIAALQRLEGQLQSGV